MSIGQGPVQRAYQYGVVEPCEIDQGQVLEVNQRRPLAGLFDAHVMLLGHRAWPDPTVYCAVHTETCPSTDPLSME